MDDQQARVTNFLHNLTELTQQYNLVVEGDIFGMFLRDQEEVIEDTAETFVPTAEIMYDDANCQYIILTAEMLREFEETGE